MYARIYACACVFEKSVFPMVHNYYSASPICRFRCSNKSKIAVKPRFRSFFDLKVRSDSRFDDAKVGIKKSTDKERLCMRHTLRLMRLYLRQMRSLCAFLFLRKRVFR